MIKKSSSSAKISPAPVIKKSPAASKKSEEEAPLKRIEKILEMAKTLREKSETPSKLPREEFVRKRDQKY